MIDEKDLIYVAGFFDGEGTIVISTHNQKLKNSKTVYYRLMVQISNTYFPIMEWFYEKFGGSLNFHKDKRPNHNPILQWRVTERKAVEFLILIMPYLRLKSQEAEIALSFYKVRSKSRNYVRHKYNPTMLEQQKYCELLKTTRKNNILNNHLPALLGQKQSPGGENEIPPEGSLGNGGF